MLLARPLLVVKVRAAADGDAVGRMLGRLGRALGAVGSGSPDRLPTPDRRAVGGRRPGMLPWPDGRPVGSGRPVGKAARSCRSGSPPKSVGKGGRGWRKERRRIVGIGRRIAGWGLELWPLLLHTMLRERVWKSCSKN